MYPHEAEWTPFQTYCYAENLVAPGIEHRSSELAVKNSDHWTTEAVGVWISVLITVFGTYEGASTIMHKTLDWKRSRISLFDVEVVPHSCIPYAQIGLRIVAYREF
jgi:hypothetical protein